MAAVIPLSRSTFSARCSNLPPVRQKDTRRKHLTPHEVERMLKALRQVGGRLGDRDILLVMLAYRHGLRAAEVTELRWDNVDLEGGILSVHRKKHGSPSQHSLRGLSLPRICGHSG